MARDASSALDVKLGSLEWASRTRVGIGEGEETPVEVDAEETSVAGLRPSSMYEVCIRG